MGSMIEQVKAKYATNEMTEKQKKNWVSGEDIDKKIKELSAKVLKPESISSHKEYSAMSRYLMLSLHKAMPVRNDLADAKVITDPKLATDDKVNYIIINNKKKKTATPDFKAGDMVTHPDHEKPLEVIRWNKDHTTLELEDDDMYTDDDLYNMWLIEKEELALINQTGVNDHDGETSFGYDDVYTTSGTGFDEETITFHDSGDAPLITDLKTETIPPSSQSTTSPLSRSLDKFIRPIIAFKDRVTHTSPILNRPLQSIASSYKDMLLSASKR
jgi:hypothetical protein